MHYFLPVLALRHSWKCPFMNNSVVATRCDKIAATTCCKNQLVRKENLQESAQKQCNVLGHQQKKSRLHIVILLAISQKMS